MDTVNVTLLFISYSYQVHHTIPGYVNNSLYLYGAPTLNYFIVRGYCFSHFPKFRFLLAILSETVFYTFRLPQKKIGDILDGITLFVLFIYLFLAFPSLTRRFRVMDGSADIV